MTGTESTRDGAVSIPPGAFVVALADVPTGDLASAGGKAVNLAALIRGGFPTPPGFIITTAAYDRVVAANELEALIAQASEDADRAAAARAAFARATVPPEVETAILVAYRRLGSGAVAVRSSATAEDLPHAAFAGQQESFLNVAGTEVLMDAVRGCWASLWSDRAIAYRAQQGIAQATVKLAVVVQRMIDAQAAGVLFTANPLTGARDETIIDANPGLGEAVVAGLVTPDHYLLRQTRRGWQIVERQIGRREVIVQARTGGGTEPMTGASGAGPALPDAALRELARLGAAIARRFGRPQDIEWAWANDEPFILQARPITALPEPSRHQRTRARGFTPIEYFQVRPYPLDMTTWMPALFEALPRMFNLEHSFPSSDQLWIEDDGVVVRFGEWPRPRLTAELLLAPLRFVVMAWRYDPASWREDPLLAEADARLRDVQRRARDLPELSWAQLLAMVREIMSLPIAVMELRRRYLPRTLLAAGALLLALKALGFANQFGALLSGAENATLQANRELEILAAEIRADPVLAALFATHEASEIPTALAREPAAAPFLAHVQAFLDRYGHRETASPMLVSQPTWADAPEVVFGILKGMALAPLSRSDGAPAWIVTRDTVLAHPMLEAPPLREGFLRLLREARRFMPLREDTHFLMTEPLPLLRRILLELGRRLVAVGALDAAEDVFHLRFDELECAGQVWPPRPDLVSDLRAASDRRAALRASLADTPLLGDGFLPALAPPGDALVAGSPGSPGVAEGPVRIVRDAAAFGILQPGEVLVAPYTNPSWTPLFRRAAAVVVDTGSAVSHAAIVAREYGIPAVMGSGDGTQRLRDGQRVRVDGSQGLVFAAEQVTPFAPRLEGDIQLTRPFHPRRV
jgi:pyruvate,water dikinase